MRYPFLWLVATSLLATFATMPAARWVGARAGLLDHPHRRKLQTQAVPRSGGISVLLGLGLGSVLLVELSGPLGIPISRELVAVFLGAILIHLVGLADDFFDVPAPVKLGAQSLIVGFVIGNGLLLERIAFPGGAILVLGAWSIPVTAFFLLGFVNAVNLVDGLDGLAAGIVAVGALALALVGLLEGNHVLAALCSVLLGATLGFLPHNFRKEKTFLGDAGSMLLGFLLGATILLGGSFSGTSTAFFVGVACAAFPILDTATTILRRTRNGRRLFRPDSMHIHHRMVRFGLSPRRTVLTIVALTLFSVGQVLVFWGEGTRLLLVASTAAAGLAAVQLMHRRASRLTESDGGFRDIVGYLLGAQEGSGPLMDEKVAMAEVIAAVDAARVAEQEATRVVAGGGPPIPIVPERELR